MQKDSIDASQYTLPVNMPDVTEIPVIMHVKGLSHMAVIALAGIPASEQSRHSIRQVLHPEEIDLYDRFTASTRKQTYLMGRYVAKSALQVFISRKFPEIHISTGKNGSPVIEGSHGSNVHISISHCKDVAVAVAFKRELQMAVDIERARPDKTEVLRKELTGNYQVMETLDNICELNLLTMLWTIKEAASKLSGKGIHGDHTQYDVCKIVPHKDRYTGQFSYDSSYRFDTCCYQDLVLTLVYPSEVILEMDNPLMKYAKAN